MILTDEDAKEIHRVLCATVGADYLTIAKAASDFTIKKLAEGVSVEPTLYRDATGNVWDGVDLRHDEGCTQLFTTDQLNTAIAAARVQTIEECAISVENWTSPACRSWSSQERADAIRALLGKEVT